MDHAMLPLNYFCRNARLCMKKAAFSKKAQLFNDELLHLKKFLALVVTTIPAHPLYEEKKTEKQIVELQTLLPDIKRRMQQLEAELAGSKPKDSTGVLKTRKVHPKPLALPRFSSETLPCLQQQKPAKKVKNVVLKKLRKQQDREAWLLSKSINGPDQGSPSASSSASPLREHAFDSPQEKDLSRTISSVSRDILDDEMAHKVIRESVAASSMPSGKIGNGVSPIRNRSLFSAPCVTTAGIQSQQQNGDWHGPVTTDHSSKHDLPKPYTHRNFQNVLLPSFKHSTSVEKHGNGGLQHGPNDLPSVSQTLNGKNNGSQYMAVCEPSREELTGFTKSWWNKNGIQNHLFPDQGVVKAESMHKEWVCSRNGTTKAGDAETLAAQANFEGFNLAVPLHGASESPGQEHGSSGHRSAKNAKEKDGLVMSIRSKLEEEYEKLKDQMKWLKYKEKFLGKEHTNRNQRGFTSLNGESACTKEVWDHKDEVERNLNVTNGESLMCEHGHDGNKEKDQPAEDNWTQEPTIDSHASNILQREKTYNLHSVAAGTSPPSPSSYHSSLPFSHYISKLKKLVPNDGSADTSSFWPMQPLNCHTHMARPDSNSPFHGLFKKVPFVDQPENACAHTPSSSDTFPDSLTYSNPVFELDGELDLPENDTMSMQLDRGLPKERIIPEEEETLEAFSEGCTLFSGHLEKEGTKNSHLSLQSSGSTEKTLEPSGSCTFAKHAGSDLTSESLNCVLGAETFEDGDFRCPLKGDEAANFTIAGHKFRFAKDFFLRKMQEKLDKIEQVKNLCKGNEGTKNTSVIEASTVMHLAGDCVSSGCPNDSHLGWTSAQDWVEKQAQCIQNSFFLCPKVGATTQEEGVVKSSFPLNPCKETVDVPWQLVNPQNSTEAALQEASIKRDGHLHPFLQEGQSSSGHFLDENKKDLLDNTGPCKEKVDIRDSKCHEGDGQRLQARIEQLEQDLQKHKDGSARENESMKNYIDKDIRMKLDELVSTLEWTQQLLVDKEHEKERFAYGLHVKVEDCEGKVKLIQAQVDCLIEEIKSNLIKEMMGSTCFDSQAMKEVCKGQLEVLEREMSKNEEALRRELASSIESMQSKTDSKVKSGCEALESLIFQKLDGKNALHSSADRDAIAELRSELCRVWEEIRRLSEGRDEISDQVGKLTKETKDSLNREQSVILTESEVLKKKLKSLKKESLKSRNESKEIRREVQEVVESFQTAFIQIREDSLRESESLKRLEESLLNDKVCMENLCERVRQTEGAIREDVATVRAFREEFLREKANSSVAEKEFVMERMDQLSHYYLGALDEVREDLLAVKMIGQDRLQDMEYRWEDFTRRQHQSTLERANSLHDLVMDGLESRISHLEHILDSTQDLQRAQFKVDSILAITKKDQECASAAAAKAMASAHKADEILVSIRGSFRTEIDNARSKSLELQETLQLEREAAAMACSEIRALSADLLHEKNMAVAASSEAKRRSFEIWEGLQNDMMNLRKSLCLIDKDKEVASAAASEAMAAASRAEALLEGLTKAYEEVSALHAGKEEVGDSLQIMKEMDSKEEKRCEMVEMRDRMQEMVAALSRVAKNTSQLDEEHRKQEMCLLDLTQQIMATAAEQKGMMESVYDVSKKVQNLDHALSSLSQTVDKVHTSTKHLEKATIKHEAVEGAAVAELEKRICSLENPFQRDNVSENTDVPSERQPIGAMEKQHLLSLYKEMSAFFRKLQTIEGPEEEVSEADKQIPVELASLETRVVRLENRVHQVEAGTSLATRALESRMEIFSSQLQTAIEAAMTAEGKCSALGSELVKVFRTLASSKKGSPPRLTGPEENSEQHKNPKAEPLAGIKNKVPPTSSACTSCKKGSNKGSSVATESSTRECYELNTKASDTKPDSDSRVRSPNCMSIEGEQASLNKPREVDTKCTGVENTHANSLLDHARCISSGHNTATYAHANASSIEAYKGSTTSASRMGIHGNDGAFVKMGRKFSLTAHSHSQDQVAEACEASGKNLAGDKVLDIVRKEDSGVMILEGKLPITHAKLGKRRIECTKKESIHLSSTARDYQMTDIRLDAGRIFVNVSHRSAFISGTRLVKRGDTLIVKSEA